MASQSISALKLGKVDVLFSSPEALMTDFGRELLTSDIYGQCTCLLAFDEAHCITEWASYGDVSLIRSWLSQAPVAVLTATCTKDIKENIEKKLLLNHQELEVVATLPDRPNIFLSIEKGSNLEKDLRWYADILRVNGVAADKAIVYCRSMTEAGAIYGYLMHYLGDKAWVTTTRDPVHRIVDIYHRCTPPVDQERVLTQFPQAESEIRCVIATVAFGFSDCTRCFSCGVGLRNWEDEDIPWIEHARWCPNCEFLHQRKGDLFIQMHRQDNNHEAQYVPQHPRSTGHFDDSMKDMKKATTTTSREEEDIAVSSVLEMGYSRSVVNSAVEQLRTQGKTSYSATDIMEVIFEKEEVKASPNRGTPVQSNISQTATHSRTANSFGSRTASVSADGQSLLEENQNLKAQMTCKICLDKDACMVYLPCGHMVTCKDCASTIRKCCICRKLIQGVVKAYM